MRISHALACVLVVNLLASAVPASGEPKAVFLIGEREYETNVTLPQFAAAELIPRGYECVVVNAAGDEGPARNQFDGIEAIDNADLLIISTRRRTLPKADLDRVRKHLADGKPLIAIRTACHGFALRKGEPDPGFDVWQNFDTEVMGIRYENHLKEKESTYRALDVDHPVLAGLSGASMKSDGTLYRMYDLAEDATLLINGSGNDAGEDVVFPAAWVRTLSTGSRIFATTMGHKSEFKNAAFRKLLANACAWCLDDEQRAAAPGGAALAATYGFEPVEVYELDWRTFGLQSGDFNSDGLVDLAAVDNRKSRLALFLQRAESGQPQSSERPNEIVDPARFEQKSVLVDRAVTALATADINGDGKTDLVTLEDPERLVIRVQTDNGFQELKTIRIPGASEGPFALAAADLDSDGDGDIVVLGERTTTLFESLGSEGIAAGRERLNTSDELTMLQLVDVDGDGRLDWSYSALDPAGTFLCVRTQLEEPLTFSAEVRLAEDESRAIAVGNADGAPGVEYFLIDAQTGRVEAMSYGVDRLSETTVLSNRVTQYGLSGGKQDRAATTGDFNGDGRLDLAVSNPAAAELILFLQDDGGFSNAILCPTLLGIHSLHAANFDGVAGDELLVLSEEEQSIGVASWNADKQQLAFPRIVPLTGSAEPLTAAVPDFVARDKQGFVVVNQRGRNNTVFTTLAFESGEWSERKTVKLGDEVAFAASTDCGLLELDADADSRSDFIALPRRAVPVLFTADNAGELIPLTGQLSLPKLERKQATVGLDGQSLLITQSKFVRRMKLDEARNWQVVDQYNATSPSATFESAVELKLENDRIAVCAYDNKAGQVVVFGVSDKPQTVDVGRLSLQQLLTGDFDGDGHDDLLLVGSDRVGLVRSSGIGPSLKTRFTYETDDEKAYFGDLLVADINADGQSDLIINETRQHTIAIVAIQDVASRASQAIRFKLFEEKSFSSSREQPGLQPREMIAADITGDGRNDLIMLCHDRLLIHPQDAGSPRKPTANETDQ